MPKLFIDFDVQIPAYKSSILLHDYADNVLSWPSTANLWPISVHSLDRHLLNEMAIVDEDKLATSETVTVRSLNSTRAYGFWLFERNWTI
jgi:ligand-binding sensor domain-containing protein